MTETISSGTTLISTTLVKSSEKLLKHVFLVKASMTITPLVKERTFFRR